MVLRHLSFQLMDLSLEFSIGSLCLLVEFKGGGSLVVDGLVVLEGVLLTPLLLSESVSLLRQSVALPLQEGHLVFLVLDLDVLVIGQSGLHCLHVFLQPSDHAQLLLRLRTVLESYLLGLFDPSPHLSCRTLDHCIDHLLQLVDLAKQFAVLEHETSAVTQRDVNPITLLPYQPRLSHHFYLLSIFPHFSHTQKPSIIMPT